MSAVFEIARVKNQLDQQNWDCPNCGMKILPGSALAIPHDNDALVHLICAQIGKAPFVYSAKDND